MKKVILYVTGGLGNRIIPLASCIGYAKLTNRKLYCYWPTDNRCRAKFTDLFDNKFDFINDEFLNNLNDNETEYYYDALDGVLNDHNLYGRRFLFGKYNEKKISPNIDNVDINNNKQNILLITNKTLKTVSLENVKKIIKEFNPIKEIKDSINECCKKLNINKNIIGAHMRGTDFNIKDNEIYFRHIRKYVSSDKKVLVCSDDRELKNKCLNDFPNMVISRKQNNYVEKINTNKDWNYNIETNVESIKEAIIDAYLLSYTDFKIYNERSTFSDYVKFLGGCDEF